ncbi:type IX secretion system protein PorQ [Lutibacter sp. A80]|uniref:type IX secretion system protein PorQ n=1 Tax=Lutibacter sp. A80 TaxID=2918453 RepID=UPI001F058575|nr:type IX secretion system protein PorQ [Lutibacter sp. A80]UMB60881.1 type IX secretion system protein PorQ [Lutibacter sp. A80]
MKNILLFLLLFSTHLFSQVGGESIYNFLNISSSARQAGLGGNVLTLTDDVNQPIWNPATVNGDIHNKLSVNYLNYLADLNLASVAYAYKFNDKVGAFHTSINYLNYGKFIGADEQGVETGSFKAYDLAFSVGYAYNIPQSDFFVGTNIKLINSVIENYSSIGIGADLGILFSSEDIPYSFTFVIRNIGYQITVYDEIREDLPTQMDLGFSYRLQNVPIVWFLTIDNLQQWDISVSNPSNSTTSIEGVVTEEEIGFFDNAIRHFTIGTELFSKRAFNIRLGYNFRRSKELQLIDKRTFSGFTAGFGLKMNKLKFSYAFSKYHPASNASTFSLQINLN